MIKIDFSEPDADDWKKWRDDCEKKTTELVESHERGEELEITDLYKKQKTFYFDTIGPFSGKCAYCETLVYDQYGDVEHFRPKGRVTDENDRIVQLGNAAGTEEPHPGYYWLAYDFLNLLPSCIRCNQKEKRNRFPVHGEHATRPGDEAKEEALLLHPVVDDPAEHLEIDSTGTFTPKNGSAKGGMTIKVLDLNAESLVSARQGEYRDTKNSLAAVIFSLCSRGDEDVSQIENTTDEINQGRREFCAVARRAVKDMDENLGRGRALLSQNNHNNDLER